MNLPLVLCHCGLAGPVKLGMRSLDASLVSDYARASPGLIPICPLEWLKRVLSFVDVANILPKMIPSVQENRYPLIAPLQWDLDINTNHRRFIFIFIYH